MAVPLLFTPVAMCNQSSFFISCSRAEKTRPKWGGGADTFTHLIFGIPHFVDEVGYEAESLQIVHGVALLCQRHKNLVEVLEGLEEDRGVGLEEPKGHPLENQVQVGDDPGHVGLQVLGQGVDSLVQRIMFEFGRLLEWLVCQFRADSATVPMPSKGPPRHFS